MSGESLLINLFAVFVLLAMLILTIGFVYFYVKRMAARRQILKKLREQGVTTLAEVLQRLHETNSTYDAEGNSRTDHYHYVIVDFKANGASHQIKISISHKTYNNLEEGSRVEVVYLPDQPEVAVLASQL
jgi:hypothetical protein